MTFKVSKSWRILWIVLTGFICLLASALAPVHPVLTLSVAALISLATWVLMDGWLTIALDGLTYRTWMRTRHIPWSQMKAISLNGRRGNSIQVICEAGGRWLNLQMFDHSNAAKRELIDQAADRGLLDPSRQPFFLASRLAARLPFAKRYEIKNEQLIERRGTREKIIDLQQPFVFRLSNERLHLAQKNQCISFRREVPALYNLIWWLESEADAGHICRPEPGPKPGKSFWRHRLAQDIVATLPFALLSLGLFYAGWLVGGPLQQVQKNPSETIATVTKAKSDRAAYEFSVEGRVYEGADFSTAPLAEGSRVSVKYHSDHPEISHLAATDRPRQRSFIWFVGGLFLLMVIGIVILNAHGRRALRRRFSRERLSVFDE